MAAQEHPQGALQTIFSFFLGLMVVAFVGVGVNTFYPSPAEHFNKPIEQLSRRQESIDRKAAPGTMSPGEQAALDSLRQEMDTLRDRQQAQVKDWARVTSIILVLFATFVLVASLLLAEQLRVISNGLLLGGLFTMLYGVGWVVFSGNSVARFWVITLALVVSIGLGYLKFVRGRRRGAGLSGERPSAGPQWTQQGIESGRGPDPVTAPAPASIEAGAFADLSQRVSILEERASAAATALGGERSPARDR